MSLVELIKGKRNPTTVATATPATLATELGGNDRAVATVATVAVARPHNPTPAHLTPAETAAICVWLAEIGETDPENIADLFDQCRQDAAAREYFIGRATVATPRPLRRRTH